MQYKLNAEEENVRGVPNCSSRDLRRQIDLLFARMTEFGVVSFSDLKNADTLSWEPDLTPLRRKNPMDFKGIFQTIGTQL
jgi:hypothetical protein